MRARWPWSGSGHGPLPPLLVLLTVGTGLVDAVSYISLGHVCVANMTGNVVFLGFALAGAAGLSVTASLAALAAFLAGAVVGGRLGVRVSGHRGWDLRASSVTSAMLVLLAVVIAAMAGQPVADAARYGLIVTLALALGIQNATARRLAVPDLTTTVLTLTLAGVAADSRLAGGAGGHPSRRLISASAMFLGALIGALLIINVDLVLPLAIAAALMVATAVVVHVLSEEDSSWAHRSSPPR
jgi:uncharacterized membrane protein YoaK (UPF0700 family)